MKLLQPDQPPREDNAGEVLQKNLEALAVLSPGVARAISMTPARADCEFPESGEADPGLVVGGRTVASRKRPVTEGERLAASVDPKTHAGVCLLGFGAGYHARALASRLGRAGVIVCFEPDLGLMRAVFERVDHSAWIAGSRFVMVHDADDRAGISRAIEGVEGIIALGMKIVAHPASEARLGAQGEAFSGRFTEVVTATKTVIATTLARSGVTLRNLVMNADRYAAADGIAALAGCARGRPAVVVAAGPSLARNVDLLSHPGVRDRVVIVAVQTVLKTLLERGIKPHIVCTLDHHEISARFYEGVTAADVEGVTLVADPKVNPAVLEAWPGRVRMTGNELLDELLGEDAGDPKGSVKPGATVAHLCHYMARHMGADPVILIGQDLGFTDGQYYASGAAIHNVWAGELGVFNTLESMEWQRIARAKRSLIPATDVFGRTIYTDEQMASYLAQFEVDFAADVAMGLSVIDATEGGVSKQHTSAMTLADALGLAGNDGAATVPMPGRMDLAGAQARVIKRIRAARRGARDVAFKSRETAKLLRQAGEAAGNVSKINRIVTRIHAIRDEVVQIEPAWRLVQFLDQNGALSRIKADRSIELEGDLTPEQRQQREIERDAENVERIATTGDEVGEVLESAAGAISGEAARVTRTEGDGPVAPAASNAGRVEAVIFADPDCSGMGTARDLSRGVAGGMNALRMTVTRALESGSIAGVCVCAGDAGRVRGLLGDLADSPRVSVETIDLERVRARVRAVGRARVFSHDAWRGGIAGLTCYDEVFEPETLAEIAARRSLDAAVVLGADWALVDPAIIDACVARWRAHPESNKVVFTQAVPGLGAMVLGRSTIETVRDVAARAGAPGSIGGMLGYLPGAPQHDPIATRLCVGVDTRVRDLGARVIADSDAGVARVAEIVEKLGDAWASSGAARIADAARGGEPDAMAQHLELELCTGRLITGAWARWRGVGQDACERPVMSMPTAHAILKQFAEVRPDGALTLGGAGDPLMHERALDIATMAVELGVGSVHIRTELLRERVDLEALASCGAGVISVDVLANSRETYTALTGIDRFEAVVDRTSGLAELSRSRSEGGLPAPWVVPRITRCDEVYAELPDFYDRWCALAGAVQVDALVRAVPGARIAPLAVPAHARARLDRGTVLVRSDGRAVLGGAVSEGSVADGALADVWRSLTRRRETAEVAAA